MLFRSLITRENLRRYAKALACLTDRDRQLIVLRLMRGLSCLDVADRLGMRSEAAVHMAVRRALQRLEKSLNEVDSPSMPQGFDTHRLPQHSAALSPFTHMIRARLRPMRRAAPVAACWRNFKVLERPETAHEALLR